MTEKTGREAGFSFGCLLILCAAAALAGCAHNKTMASAAKPSPAVPSASAVPAAKAPAPAPAPTYSRLAESLKTHKFWGIIESVDAKDDSVTLKSRDGVIKNFMVFSDTRINRGGGDAPATFAALKPGEHLRVIYAQKYAKAIHVMVLASHAG
ncbi:MAG TPA: hypothetical protein VNH15_04265 [Elusimicrobiota bacterium]|nr:hypothetical protein [Elusimicrobiota bacterium]